MFTEAQKAKIADTIHEVICEHTGLDGVGCCTAYAVVGAGVLSNLSKTIHLPQAGTLQIACDPESEWAFTMDGSRGLAPVGEFHCWIALPPNNTPLVGGSIRRLTPGTLTLIDFSARHYRAMMTRTVSLGGNLPQWKIEDPPTFLWTNRLPSWLYLMPEPVATDMMIMELDTFTPWVKETLHRLPHWCRPAKAPRMVGNGRQSALTTTRNPHH